MSERVSQEVLRFMAAIERGDLPSPVGMPAPPGVPALEDLPGLAGATGVGGGRDSRSAPALEQVVKSLPRIEVCIYFTVTRIPIVNWMVWFFYEYSYRRGSSIAFSQQCNCATRRFCGRLLRLTFAFVRDRVSKLLEVAATFSRRPRIHTSTRATPVDNPFVGRYCCCRIIRVKIFTPVA